ncbi:MAG: metal ABC transporter solute-binding protein, Zn/Mn family [Acidimicrobiales bacterium]
MGGRVGRSAARARAGSWRAPVVCAIAAASMLVSGGTGTTQAAASTRRVTAVGAENEYANVISQIGGPHVTVRAIMTNPNTDPHTFEASTRVAQEVAAAQLVVQNGVGYDTFMHTIEAASPSKSRKVVDVQTVRHLPDTTKNPHLWYDPKTMPKVAKAIAKDLDELDPAHASYFEAHLRAFDRSLGPWRAAIRTLRAKYEGTPVATTEPVADDVLEAAGIDDKTPWAFQADIMNGIDPSPQVISYEEKLVRTRLVRALVYNKQVTDSMTTSLLAIAKKAHVPIVGVYETMPEPGYDYQRWMVAEVDALEHAFAHHESAPKL